MIWYSTNVPKSPIFIVGCGHSGTSLLLAILGAHSKIHAIPFESGVAAIPVYDASLLLKDFNKQTLLSGKHRWVEKTPKHIYHIPGILRLCQDAKVLLIIRDGRDVACSIQDRTGNLLEGAHRWVNDNLAGKRFWHHPSVHVLKYENLVEQFEATMKGVFSFIGENYEPGVKDYYKTPLKFYSTTIKKPPSPFGKNHNQYRNWQINQPLFDGRGKYKRLTDLELLAVMGIAGGLLGELGYI